MRGERLSDLGEDRLIARLTTSLPGHPDLRIGPGDDCAAIGAPDAPFWTLLKTDAVVEGVHFTPETEAHRIGWKALARAVSDIAAMGGEPEHALISLMAAPSLEVARLEALYGGLAACARRFGISLTGGETVRSPEVAGEPGPLVVSVTLTGRVEAARCVCRSGGQPGDWLLVTGRLGGSFASGKHLDFIPRLREARWLVAHALPNAMMDLSDGLASDLPRLAAASGCGYELEEAALPCAEGVGPEAALRDGEDFELLFALPPDEAQRVLESWPFEEVALSVIGRLTPPDTALPDLPHGFDHFPSPARDL